jgi:hypothetical protein
MRRTLLLLVLVAALALPACAKLPPTVTPRDVAAVSLSAFSQSIGAMQDGVVAACNAKLLTVVRCQDAGKVFMRVWTYDTHLVDAVIAWKPGQALPANLAAEIQAMRGLITDLGLDKILPDKVVIFYAKLADVLLLFMPGGVA